MNLLTLENSGRMFFTNDTVAEILGISKPAARVLCARYFKNGIFLKLKKNIYVLRSRFDLINQEDIFYLSNLIQTPSYISLMTALAYYEVTTQVIRPDVVEAIGLTRSCEFESGNLSFAYRKINFGLYFGFKRIGKFFIASKEKAFLDILYLKTFGKYDFDLDSIDFGKLSISDLKILVTKFPRRTRTALIKILTQYKNARFTKT